MIGRLLCRLGLHRWRFAEAADADAYRTYAWCARPGCRYEGARCVDVELRLLGLDDEIRRSDSAV